MSKYHAIKTVVHGVTFDSKKEAHRYSELLLLGQAGVIRNLELQPSFPLHVTSVCREAPVMVGVYRGDFRYDERVGIWDWVDVVEDVKGVRTPVYLLKKRMVEALYGITVRET